MRLLFDLETDDFLDGCTRIWCAAARDLDTDEIFLGVPKENVDEVRESGTKSTLLNLNEFVELLTTADLLAGHNIATFDIPVLEKLYPSVRGRLTKEIICTLCVSRAVFHSTIFSRSLAFQRAAGRSTEARNARMPGNLLRSHSLESWGYRLGERKGGFLKKQGGAAKAFSLGLLAYCVGDVSLNVKLFNLLQTEGPLPAAKDGTKSPPMPEAAQILESKVGYILGQQERNGVGFDADEAEKLVLALSAVRDELAEKLRAVVGPWRNRLPDFIPKRDNKVRGYKKGVPVEKYDDMVFNPGSHVHIADRLMTLYGWKPESDAYTERPMKRHTGEIIMQPKVDETVLAGLDYPIIPDLLQYLTVNKRLGALVDGDGAWLKMEKRGVIHGRCFPSGTRTNRGSHSKPNLSGVPKNNSPFGEECRSLFTPTRPGWVMVGADASGLQLRCLAHRMAYYDGGAFGVEVVDGDVHETMRKATGLFYRTHQKTFTYAKLFGAGFHKQGTIVLEDWRQAYAEGLTEDPPPSPRLTVQLGKAASDRLLRGLEALDKLTQATKRAHARGYIRALDGRPIVCKSVHGVLNDVLQSDEGVVMKVAMVLLHDNLSEAGLVLGEDFAQMMWIHDEFQFEARTDEIAHQVGAATVEAIKAAGVKLGLRVPLDGEYAVGASWKETH